jgi:hypothetical protein
MHEVYQFVPPQRLGACPLVTPGERRIAGTIVVDVLLSKKGSTPGFIGNVEVWAKNVIGIPEAGERMVDQEMSFTINAPYTVSTPGHPQFGEQPIRALNTFAWTVGRQPVAGKTELDSMDVSYPTCCNSPPDDRWSGAGAYVTAPVVISNLPGSIDGEAFPSPGGAHSWRVITDWDTTGYRFQWYVDGVKGTADTGATLTRAFTALGSHTLRADQILVDSTVLTSSRQVTVPFLASISGPAAIGPGINNSWFVVAPYGTQPYSYQWNVDGAPIGNGESLTTQFGPSSSHVVSVTVTDANAFQASASITVEVSSGGDCPPDEQCNEALRTPSGVPTIKPANSPKAPNPAPSRPLRPPGSWR